MFADVMDRLDQLEPLLEAVNDKELTACAGFLADRIEHPDSYVTFLGETSSGKSTIINGLIGKPELVMKACPSTGTITEVELCDGNLSEYYAINKDATIESIDRTSFCTLTEKPDSRLQRLKLKAGIPDNTLHHMRIFDTPGYGSIVSEHEEILKEFLPNSDVVVYTVRYNIGIQENDYAFLGFLHELVREDTEIILVINCCPDNITDDDRRIKEIAKYAHDILTVTPKTFYIKKIRCDNEDEYPLPRAEMLWKYISGIVNGNRHQALLKEAFNGYVTELYKKLNGIINSWYIQTKLTDDELEEMRQLGRDTAKKLRKSIPDLIEPAFNKIEANLPDKFKAAADMATDDIITAIDNTNGLDKDQMTSYINAHLLPYTIKKRSEEIQNYIQVILTDLNERVNDYISKQIEEYTTCVDLKINSHAEIAVKNAGSKLVERAGTQALKHVFTQFGGAGGANAGIANAASHLLKKVGDLFGKTFSRETHNTLKHVLAKIGATSMKAVSIAITVVVEVLMTVADYATWKSKLRKAVKKATGEWLNETLPSALKDIRSCCQDNIARISDLADSFEQQDMDDERPNDSEKILELMKLSEQIGKNIGVGEE